MGRWRVSEAEELVAEAENESEDGNVSKAIILCKKAVKLEPENAEITMRASTNNSLNLDNAKTMINLLDVLEDLEDVQKVYSNAEISEDILVQFD